MDRDQQGRFLPGNVVGLAGGRPPKGATLTDILVEALEQPGKGKDRRRALANKLIELAFDGNMDALRYLYNRVDGMPHESRELSGHLGTIINVVPFE